MLAPDAKPEVSAKTSCGKPGLKTWGTGKEVSNLLRTKKTVYT